MNTPAQEHVCYDFLYSFAQWLLRHSELEGRESDAKDLERNLAAKITALLNDYFACDALIRFDSYLEAEAERYCSVNDERRKLIVENVQHEFECNISGLIGIARDNAENHDKKCRELARKDWLNHVDFMALIGILDGVKSLGLDEARIEDKQYLVESFNGCLPHEKLILLNESPAFPCTPMELADWFEQIKLPLNKIIPSFVDELAAIEATKVKASPEPGQAKGGVEAVNRKGQEGESELKTKIYAKKEALISQLIYIGVDKVKLESLLSNANKNKWLADCKSPDGSGWHLPSVIFRLAHNTDLLPPEIARKFLDKALDEALSDNST